MSRPEEKPENAIDIEIPEVTEGETPQYPSPKDGFYPVPVTTGLSDNYNVEIKEGLQGGETVFQAYIVNRPGLRRGTAMLIEIKNIYKIYNEGKESEVRALDGVTLSIDRGEFVAIIGASGSGKSTLMNILGCLDVPTYGDYILNGTDVTDRTDRQLAHIRNKEIGFIFQAIT